MGGFQGDASGLLCFIVARWGWGLSVLLWYKRFRVTVGRNREGESASKSNIKQIVLNMMCYLNQMCRLKGNQTRPQLYCHYMVIYWEPINYTALVKTGVTFSRLSRALSVLNEPCFLIWHDRCLILLTFSGMHKQLRLQLFIHQRMQSYLMVLIYWRVLLNKSCWGCWCHVSLSAFKKT